MTTTAAPDSATGPALSVQPSNAVDWLLANARERGTQPALRWREGDQWRTTTWSEHTDRVARAAAGLRALGRSVVGVDLSPEMLRRAFDRVGPRVAVGDAQRLPVRDGAVAAAYSVWVLHLVADRLAHRDHEYMPTTLLDSQIETLEPLADWEQGIVISIEQRPEAIVDEVTRILTGRAAGRAVEPRPGATITGAIDVQHA